MRSVCFVDGAASGRGRRCLSCYHTLRRNTHWSKSRPAQGQEAAAFVDLKSALAPRLSRPSAAPTTYLLKSGPAAHPGYLRSGAA